VLSAALFRHALDVDRVSDIDYLTGDDDYKRDWMTHRRERVGLVAFRKASIAGRLSWVRHRLGRLRSRLRRTVDPSPMANGPLAGRDPPPPGP
jgi:CelD/BcsL family acetyltransferase involved in cellulose biosynthesis